MHGGQSALTTAQRVFMTVSRPQRPRPKIPETSHLRAVDSLVHAGASRPTLMPSTRGLPDELVRLLTAAEEGSREAAWAEFADRYRRLLMRIAKDDSSDYDGAMDRYAYVLEGLRKDDFGRLRRYASDSRGKFTTWLVVVARRLCTDYRRVKYGRARGSRIGDARVADRQDARRRLTEMVVADLDPQLIADAGDDDAESALRRQELSSALSVALGELDTTEQLLLKLRFEDGLPAREIASVLGMPTAFHVYRQVTQCLKRLRAALESLGVTDAVP
jgi:RNA polymerase sigma factor (sigma-70 family)